MKTKERLFNEIRTVCTATHVDFEKVSIELSEFIGHDKIIDYYITKGKLPSSPEALFDIMVLGEKALYDYDMIKKGALLHFEPLNKITEVTEEFEGKDYLTVNFRIGEIWGGVFVQDKLSKSKNIRRFARVVINKIGKS